MKDIWARYLNGIPNIMNSLLPRHLKKVKRRSEIQRKRRKEESRKQEETDQFSSLILSLSQTDIPLSSIEDDSDVDDDWTDEEMEEEEEENESEVYGTKLTCLLLHKLLFIACRREGLCILISEIIGIYQRRSLQLSRVVEDCMNSGTSLPLRRAVHRIFLYTCSPTHPSLQPPQTLLQNHVYLIPRSFPLP